MADHRAQPIEELQAVRNDLVGRQQETVRTAAHVAQLERVRQRRTMDAERPVRTAAGRHVWKSGKFKINLLMSARFIVIALHLHITFATEPII